MPFRSLALLLVAATLQEPPADFGPRKKAQEQIRETFKAEYAKRSPADRQALAQRLLKLALENTDDAVTGLALFMEARDLATQAADVTTALAAADEISKAFGVDPRWGKMEALEAAEKSARTKDAAAAIADAYLAIVEEAILAGDYEPAEAAAAKAESAARRSGDPARSGPAKVALEHAREIRKESAKAQPFAKRLESSPEDPEANLAYGRFLCLMKGDWEQGLPLMARGGDALLKALVERDLSNPADPYDQAELASKWWDWSDRQLGRGRLSGHERAVRWYEEAIPRLGIAEKARAEKRVRVYYEGAAAPMGGTAAPGNVALASNGAKVAGANSPDELIDGNTTRYDGSSGYALSLWPCEWVVTLARPYPLREIRMLLWDGGDRFYRYALETSADGRTFVPLVDHSRGQRRSWQTLSFAPRRVQHIKVKGLFNSSNSQFHVVELEAYCVPPATPARPIAPSE